MQTFELRMKKAVGNLYVSSYQASTGILGVEFGVDGSRMPICCDAWKSSPNRQEFRQLFLICKVFGSLCDVYPGMPHVNSCNQVAERATRVRHATPNSRPADDRR